MLNIKGPITRGELARLTGLARFVYMATGPARFAGIPVAAYRDNSVKRVVNFHVIAFCRVGSAKRVELLSDGSLYSVIKS